MSKSLQDRLDKLELLYSEQDHTIQTLNDMVAQQGQEIAGLHSRLEQTKIQLRSLKAEAESEVDSPDHGEFEIPPHY